MVECDLPNDRPVARMPNPSVRTFKAAPTITDDVRSLDIGVPLRSLNCRLHALHRYFWTTLPSWRLVVPFFTTVWLSQVGQFIDISSTLPLLSQSASPKLPTLVGGFSCYPVLPRLCSCPAEMVALT